MYLYTIIGHRAKHVELRDACGCDKHSE